MTDITNGPSGPRHGLRAWLTGSRRSTRVRTIDPTDREPERQTQPAHEAETTTALPDTARVTYAAGSGEPALSAVPIEWLNAGFTSPEAVAEWTSIGIETPALAKQWMELGFTPAGAAVWVEVEGMTPSAALAAANAGLDAADFSAVRRADPGWSLPAEPEGGRADGFSLGF
jgi:hypothetical protein